MAQLCSGDVSTLLLIYRKMFRHGHVDAGTQRRIPKQIQHAAIREVSRDLFQSIRAYHPFGARMYAVVDAFGNLVRRVLVDGSQIRQGRGKVPAQIPRIEIDQGSGSAIDALSGDAAGMARELIRRAVFIELDPGVSRHHTVTTMRWQLRRVFLPAFGAALAKNDAVKERQDWFRMLLTDPRLACRIVLRKRNAGPSGDQTDMFDF